MTGPFEVAPEVLGSQDLSWGAKFGFVQGSFSINSVPVDFKFSFSQGVSFLRLDPSDFEARGHQFGRGL